jgi:hypothetical protein
MTLGYETPAERFAACVAVDRLKRQSILDIEAGGAIEFPQVAQRSRSADDRNFPYPSVRPGVNGGQQRVEAIEATWAAERLIRHR